MELNGFTEAQIADAARVCAVGANFTAYFHGVQYPVDTFKDELAAAVEHIKSNA